MFLAAATRTFTSRRAGQLFTPLIIAFAMASHTTALSSTKTCANVPALDPGRVKLIEKHGGKIQSLDPIGAEIYGIDLKGPRPPDDVIEAIEAEMANRGFVVFKDQKDVGVDASLKASVWWGGKQLHSTHGVHPATPGYNRHIFRLSNDRNHGILGVGPQWHNDGSFEAGTFSHVGYQIIRVAEKGGGTYFAHQGAAFDALPPEKQEFWSRLSSVNSNSGVVHPMVHEHPISGRKSVWLHLGMTGAVIERLKDEEGFRLLDHDEMKELFNEYNDLLNAGLKEGYSIPYEYKDGDFLIIDNLAVGHRASPEAHKSASVQGLRILHRITVKAMQDFEPKFGLPLWMDINGRSPFKGGGIWQGGGIGFRWDDSIHMQN